MNPSAAIAATAPAGAEARAIAGHIPGIDGLRAVAVLSVMVYHLWPGALPGGFTGVDVFFVISGFVVAGSLDSRPAPTLGRYTLAFYARRVLRILPALLACLLFTTVATTLFVPDSWLSNATKQTGMYAFLGLSNHALIWTADGYFSPRAEFNPFVHTWSLAVEEQFYVLFPLVFFIWLQRGRLGRDLLWLLWLASLAWCAYASSARPDEAFYLLPARFWELATGALLYQRQRSRGVLVPGRPGPVLAAGALLIAVGFAVTDRAAFPFPWVLPAVAGAALVIAGVTARSDGGGAVRALLEHPATVAVGKLSYSLYLWHWPVYVLLRWTVGLDRPLTMAAALGASAGLAYASYRCVELPLRTHPFVAGRPRWMIVAGGLAAVWLAWHLANNVFYQKPRLSLSVTRDAATWYPDARPAAAGAPCPAIETWRELPGAGVQVLRSAADCPAGPAQGRRLFAVGDSHAGAYAALLKQLSDETGVEVQLYFRSGCSFANLREPAAEPRCKAFARAALDDIGRLARPGDIALLAALRVPRIGGQHRLYDIDQVVAEQRSAAARERLAAGYAEAEAQVAELERLGLAIVVEAPKPVFKSPPFRCADWFNADNPVCRGGFEVPRPLLLELRAPVMGSIARLAAAHPGITVWDPFFTLCPGAACSAFAGGRPLFLDGDHLSGYGNRLLYPEFRAVFDALVARAR